MASFAKRFSKVFAGHAESLSRYSCPSPLGANQPPVRLRLFAEALIAWAKDWPVKRRTVSVQKADLGVGQRPTSWIHAIVRTRTIRAPG